MLANWSGDIPNGTVWSNTETQTITGNVHIPAGATLTVQPGTVVEFTGGTNLTVDGTLKAQGTAASMIHFTSANTTPNNGDWAAIQFNSDSTGNILNDVQVLYGGGYGAPADVVDSGGPLALSNSTIGSSNSAGLRITTAQPTLTGDTFQNNNGAAVSIDLASQPTISGSTLKNNAHNSVLLDSGTLPGNATWNNPGVVYELSGGVTVPQGNTLTVGAGQVVKTDGNFFAGSLLTVNGTLKAQGTANQPIVFTSARDDKPGGDTDNDGSQFGPNKGDWQGIQLNASSTANVLDHVKLLYAGAGMPALFDNGAPLTFTNSTLDNSDSDGLRMVSAKPTLTADNFQNNSGSALSADLVSQPNITGETSASITGNGINGLALDSGSFTANATWNTTNVVYVPTGDLTVPSGITLSLGPGVIVKPHSIYNLNVEGTFKAQGTAAAPIIITSFADDSAGGNSGFHGVLGPGEGWTVWLETGSTNNVMDHVDVRYGQDVVGGNRPGAIDVDSSLTLSNSIVRDCGRDGILVSPSATATITSSIIVDNSSGVEGQAGATLTLTNNTIDGNTFFGVILASPNATLVNNLITNNGNAGINQTSQSSLAMSYNDVFNPNATNGNYNGLTDQTGTNGNISVDPKYANPSALQYNLKPGSPAEDAGTSTGAPTTDFLGNPRFKDPNIVGRGDGSGYDMGAIEVQNAAMSNIDLTVANVTAPASGVEGQSITVTWTDKDIGAGAADGPWHDAVYLTAAGVFTPDAILLGEVTHTGSLSPGQSDATPQSGTFTLPGVVPGNYYIIVRVNSRNEVFEGSNVANNAVVSTSTIATDLPALTLGTPVTGKLAATGSQQLYKVTTVAGSDLNVVLTGPNGNTNELYVSLGDVPSRQSFLARGVRIGSANQSVSLAGTQAGTYYVMVYGANLPGAETFTLTANTLGFSLSSVSPAQGSNTGQTTITIAGAQFDGNSQPQLVDSAGTTIKPTNVYFTDSGLISATFDLTGHPTGSADVQVVNKGGATQKLPHAFNIIAGQPGRLVTSLSAPSAVRLGREFQVTIDYTNAGDSDLLAPVLHLSVTSPGELSFSTDMSGAATGLDLIAVNQNGPAGILPPGASGEITVYAATMGTGTPTFQLTQASYPATPIDWADAGPTLRPANLDDADWNALVAQLKTEVGPTWDRFPSLISADATLLPPGDGLNYSLGDVFAVEVQHASATTMQSITGRVFLGDTNHPLSNAPLLLYDPATQQALDAVSLTDGTFVIPVVAAGSFTATFGNFVSNQTAPLTVGSASVHDVQFIVSPGSTITGSVSLEGIGAPVPGETVDAVGAAGTSFTTTTNPDGTYLLTGLPADTYTVEVGGTNYTTATASVTLGAGQVQPNVILLVRNAGTLSGQVTGPTGAIAGATVTASASDGTGSSTKTDSAGNYVLHGVGGTSYMVIASATGLADATGGPVVVATGGTVSGVNLSLTAAGSLQGAVTASSDKTPIANVVMMLIGNGHSFSAQTDQQGNYRFSGVPPGQYNLTTIAAGWMGTTSPVTISAGKSTTLAVSLATSGQVSGTVKDAAGQAVAAVIVRIEGTGGIAGQVTTDNTGAFTFTGLDAGTYQVVVGDLAEPGVAQLPVTLDSTHVSAVANLKLGLAGSLSGTVFEADGVTPAAAAEVDLVQKGTVLASMETDDQGHYDFDILQAGTYQLEAVSDDLLFPARANIVVSGGTVLTGLDFHPGQEQVSGTVVDSTGKPVVGAVLGFSRTDAGIALTGAASVTTDANGAFSFGGAVPGSYEVVAVADGEGFASKDFTITAGSPAVVPVTLPAEATLHGTIQNGATQAGLSGVTIALASQGNAPASFFATTDSSGNYSFSGLAAGSYRMTLTLSGFERVVNSNVVLGSGDTKVDLGMTASTTAVKGTVTSDSGPLSGADVTVLDASGNPVAEVTSDASGQYDLNTLAPGSYQIMASSLGYATSAPLAVSLSAAQTVSGLDIHLIAAALSDVVLPETGSGPSAPLVSIFNNVQQPPTEFTLPPESQQILDDAAQAGGKCASRAASVELFQTFIQQKYLQLLQQWQDGVQPLTSQSTTLQSIQINTLAYALGQAGATAEAQLHHLMGKSYGLIGKEIAALRRLGNLSTTYNDYITAFNSGDLATAQLKGKALANGLAGAKQQLAFLGVAIATAQGLDVPAFDNAFGGGLVDQAQLLAAKGAGKALGLLLPNAQNSGPLGNTLGPANALAALSAALLATQATLGGVDSTSSGVQDLNNNLATYNNYLNGLHGYERLLQVLGAAVAGVQRHCGSCTSSTGSQQAMLPTSTAMALEACGVPGDTPVVLGAAVSQTSGPPSTPPPQAAPVSTPGPSTSVAVAAPHDPNDLIGPAGSGSQGFIQPGNMPYRTDFENDPAKATAAAQVVTATLTLDSHLAPSTFQFTSFGFGSHDYTVPAGLSHYQTTIDLRPDGVSLLVPVTLDFNAATGAVTVSFQSLDPLTMQPPSGIDAGFLPIDDANHDGEGYFTFTVRPKAGLATGTQINEQASIVFDTNSPLATNTATNTIDIGTPTSSIATLPAQSPTDFTVNWSGSDDANGSGIAFYDVYVSDNGGPFTQFEVATTQTSATFTGQVGHNYSFYSVATDNVGHRQATPSAGQASTTVAASVMPFNVTEHSYVIGSGTITVSAANGLLSGDTGPSQLMVTAGSVTGADGGTFAINADGSFTYTPGSNFPGYDNAQFTVTDASGDNGTATVNVLSQHAGVVWKFYESVLNREPDPGGLQYWTNYFDNGGNTGDMAFGFFESDELLNKVLGNYYEQYLLRPLDSDGLTFWKGVWHATGGPEQIKAGFADSPEFYTSSGGTPDSWIDALYQRILSRTPDPAGKTFWLNYYQQQTAAGTDAGTVRYNIALGFFDSQESYGQDVTGWFQEYLFRAPTDSEKAQYVSQMEGGASDRTIEQAITNLPEYGANPATPADGTAAPFSSYYQTPASSAQSQATLAARDKLFGQL